MQTEAYTPGHTQNATDFMSKRSLESHGQFFLPYLTAGLSVLDCGCGPGTITLGIADRVAPGNVIGVDFGSSQIERASASAKSASTANVEFKTADCYKLPFADGTFDRVFSHALMEHLADPASAFKELHRVLKPGGIIGVCSPDWGGFILSPSSPELTQAIQAYTTLQARNGGDVRVGRKLGSYLHGSGFKEVQMSARYECYPSLEFIGGYLALQLERENDLISAETFHAWSRAEGGMFAQAWVAAVARKV
jgi:ubiquinone/menaquinone biosynthesis C-methylase UbiE